MRWAAFVTVIPFLALLSSSAAWSADQKLLDAAKEPMRICAELMPNSRAAKAAFKKAGYRYEGTDGQYHMYSLNGRRIIAGTTTTQQPKLRCIISVSKMTPAEAEALAQSWIELAQAKREVPPHRQLYASWAGQFRGGGIRIGIIETANFGVMRGAAIVAGDQ